MILVGATEATARAWQRAQRQRELAAETRLVEARQALEWEEREGREWERALAAVRALGGDR